METRVEELESAMIIKENNKKKLMRKRKKKQIKKKKKHKLDVKIKDIAVIIRCHLLREEESWSGVEWLKGANLIEKEPIKIKERIFRAYKKIFGRDCVEDIAAAANEGMNSLKPVKKSRQEQIQKISRRLSLFHFPICLRSFSPKTKEI